MYLAAHAMSLVRWMAPPWSYLQRAKHLHIQSIALLIVLMVTGNALAQRITDHEVGYTHSVWSRKDGIPDYIFSIAQTPDNWLWLASKGDLFRFDGITAERFDVAPAEGSTLSIVFATKSGDLWLGYKSGQTIMLPVNNFAHPQVIRGGVGSPLQIQEDANGDVWLRTINGLFEAKPHQPEWHPVGEQLGIHSHYFFASAIDVEGTLWVLTNDGVFGLRRDSSSFEERTDLSELVDSSAPSGTRLGGTSSDYFHQLLRYGNLYLSDVLAIAGKRIEPNSNGSRSGGYMDSGGDFWAISVDGAHENPAMNPADLRKLAQSNDLNSAVNDWTKVSSDRVITMMEDRQNNIWFGTATGLEKFQPNLATTLDLPRGVFNYAMIPGADGSIWFGNAVSNHYYRWWHVDRDAVPVEGYDMDTTSAYRDTDGSILLGTGQGYLQRFADGRFSPITPLPPGAANGDDILAIARDGRHQLWVSIVGRPIYEFRDGRWFENGERGQLPKQSANRMVADSRGRLWISYAHDLFVIDGDHMAHYARDEGMDITNIRDMLPNGIALVGGDNGLAVFDGHRFHRILAADPSGLTFINGMVRLKDGTLWLNGHEGAVRITAQELKRGIDDPTYTVALRVFGDEEGMPGVAQPIRPVPSLIEGTDGRLWFADSGGLAWLDPAKIPLNPVPPTVQIRSITVGARSYRPEQLRALDAGTRQLEIDYTALGLVDATKARFRYQLVGIDQDWQDVGTRRQAFYTNLGPGTYSFRVIASNEDGAWSTDGASINISITPLFYQTKWFLFICVGVVLAMLWLAYLYRLRQLMRRLHQRLDDRHEERDRIARELHDTYLQTVQALVFKVHAASRALPEGSTRDSIVSALNLADEALVEGRDRVRSLRASASTRTDLASAFEEVATEYVGDERPSFKVSESGTPKRVDPLIIDELYASGREAIINAFNHSHADTIHVSLSYDKDGFRIEISDNGTGMDPKIVADGGLLGHWGLRGIRERMERIGGKCRIISESESGTTLILFVDASHAYSRLPHF
jgi:signal transduction histidine kinase/ligand-binding sensor domain-containing protein